jgi:uncharacterized protein involved in oxidation of intracellular sulfur
MNVLVVVNDQPYGSERPYNALRLASALSKADGAELRVFLLSDAVACAVAGQQLPEGHYRLERMLKGLLHHAQVGCCGTCMDARGLAEQQFVEGARRSTLEELTDSGTWSHARFYTSRELAELPRRAGAREVRTAAAAHLPPGAPAWLTSRAESHERHAARLRSAGAALVVARGEVGPA